MDPGQSPPPPHAPLAPRSRASPWHLAGFTFIAADPMYTEGIRETLQHTTFMPRRKSHGERDSMLRYRTNLRFIFEAVEHFGEFWGRRDFWSRILELLKFPHPTTPGILQDIVKRYCLARLECCERITRHAPHDFKLRAPNRIAELADRINDLYRHDPECIPFADWKRRQQKWAARMYRVLCDQGVHAAQLADRTCAPELLDDRPTSWPRPPPFSPAASDSDRTAPVSTSPSLNARQPWEMASPRDGSAPDSLLGPRPSPAKASTRREGPSKTAEASATSVGGGDKAGTEVESRAGAELEAPVEAGAQAREDPAVQSPGDLLASYSTPAVPAGTPPDRDAASSQKRALEDADEVGLSRKRLATETSIIIKDKPRDEHDAARHQPAQAPPQLDSSDITNGASQQQLPVASDAATGGQIANDAGVTMGPAKNQGPGDASQTADMVQDLLMSLEKRQRKLEELEASMGAMQTKLAHRAAESTRVDKLESQLKQLQRALDNRMVDPKRIEGLHESVDDIKQHLIAEPYVKMRLDEVDSAVHRIQRQVAGHATAIGQVGRIQSDIAMFRAEQSKQLADKNIFNYVDGQVRTAKDQLMEQTQGSILKLDEAMEKRMQVLRRHVDEQMVAAAPKDAEDPRVTEVQTQLSEIQEQLRRQKTAVTTPSPLENALLEGLDAHKFIDRTTYELAKTRTALRAKVREMDAAGIPDNEPKLILSEISWEISQILEVIRKRTKRLHESEANEATKKD